MDRMGQGPGGDIIHPAFSIFSQALLGDSARGLALAAVSDSIYGFPGSLVIKIIQQDPMDSRGSEDLVYFVQVPGLHDDLEVLALPLQILPGQLYGLCDPPGEIDMVVLEHDHIVESKAMVLPTPDLDGPFFQGPYPGRSLAGIQDTGLGALQ